MILCFDTIQYQKVAYFCKTVQIIIFHGEAFLET